MGKKSSNPPPDYTPMANASAESARLAAELGQKQLDENKRQYEEGKAITAQVVDKQLELMDQSKAQGDAYFENWQKGRDVTDKVRDEVLVDNTATESAQRKAIADSAKVAADSYNDLGEEQKQFGINQANRVVDAQNQIVSDAQTQIGAAANNLQQGASNVADRMLAGVGAAAGGIGANMDRYGGDVSKAVDLYTSGNSGIIDKYGKDIEEDVGRAVTDARAGQSQATNQAIRQAIRYGVNLPDAAEGTTLGQAQMLAGAANGTRVASTNNYRDIVGKSVGMRQALLDTSIQAATEQAKLNAQAAMADGQMRMAGVEGAAGMSANAAASGAQMKSAAQVMSEDVRTQSNNQALGMKAASIDKNANIALTDRDLSRQDQATNLAKKLDVAGLYSGMTGASSGAYGLANNAGSSAVGNQNSTSGQYLQGMNAGTNTIMNGRQLAQSGLGSILNSQTSVYGDTLRANSSSSSGAMGAIGTVAGAALTVF